MDGSKIGVVIPPEPGAEGGAGAGAGDHHSHIDEGTGKDGAAKPPVVKQPEGKDGAGKGNEGGADDGQQKDPKDERINNLMSNWQKEEAGHSKTKTKLQQYEEKFGPLDGEGKPAPKAKAKLVPDISDEDPDLPVALKPGWQPKTMDELQEGLRQAAVYGAQLADRNISKRTQSAEQAQKDAEAQLDNFVTEIKAVDPEFDDKVFFQYANEHGFPINSANDLRAIYKSYVSLERAKRSAVEGALKNKDGRRNPVGKPGSGQGDNGGMPFSKISKASSAKDLVRDLLSKK